MTPPDSAAVPGPSAGPEAAGVPAVRAVLADLDSRRDADNDADRDGTAAAGSGQPGDGEAEDRLARLETAHRRLRGLLEVPDA